MRRADEKVRRSVCRIGAITHWWKQTQEIIAPNGQTKSDTTSTQKNRNEGIGGQKSDQNQNTIKQKCIQNHEQNKPAKSGVGTND